MLSDFFLSDLFIFLWYTQVRLIGYCVESCLFLVYEFIDNGNLSQHLRVTGKVFVFECTLQYCSNTFPNI